MNMRMRAVLTPFSIKIALQYKAKLNIIKKAMFFCACFNSKTLELR